MNRRTLRSLALLGVTAALAACSSSSDEAPPSAGTTVATGDTTSGAGGAGTGGATTSAGGAGAGGHAAGGAGTGGRGAGGADACWQAATMLDVASAPGAGAGYAKPTLKASCTADKFVVESNNMPPYTFVQTTPNPLTPVNEHWEVPRNPSIAAASTKVPLGGYAGFAVNGLVFFGPNEGAVPVDEAYGDPVYNGLMDPCFGHTSPQEYHYHSMDERCLVQSGVVAEPWTNPDPDPSKASPVIGWAADGFPIHGPRDCTDAGCSNVVTMESGYEKTGDPKKNAWDAYTWKDFGDGAHLDECNGHVGPKGDYHYHATKGFPYIVGCYKGTPSGIMSGGGMMGGAGGGMMGGGPKSCTQASDCVGACAAGSKGCTCASSPMGMVCAPTCAIDADCPASPMGMPMKCLQGTCRP